SGSPFPDCSQGQDSTQTHVCVVGIIAGHRPSGGLCGRDCGIARFAPVGIWNDAGGGGGVYGCNLFYPGGRAGLASGIMCLVSRVKELESRLEHTEQQLRLLQKISRFMVRDMS